MRRSLSVKFVDWCCLVGCYSYNLGRSYTNQSASRMSKEGMGLCFIAGTFSDSFETNMQITSEHGLLHCATVSTMVTSNASCSLLKG